MVFTNVALAVTSVLVLSVCADVLLSVFLLEDLPTRSCVSYVPSTLCFA